MSTKFEGKQLVSVGEQVMELPGSQEITRTAINRFYYGAFLEARDLAGIKKASGSVHEEVIKHYSSDTSVSNRLQQLKDKRNQADYRTNCTVESIEARNAKRLARKCLEALEKHRKK